MEAAYRVAASDTLRHGDLAALRFGGVNPGTRARRISEIQARHMSALSNSVWEVMDVEKDVTSMLCWSGELRCYIWRECTTHGITIWLATTLTELTGSKTRGSFAIRQEGNSAKARN